MQFFLGKQVSALCCVMLFCPATFLGQQRDTVLREVYVVGAVGRSATKESAPVQVMNRNKMEKLGLQDLHEAVRTFAGASVKDYGGIGGVKTVSVRNLGAQHTAVSYDGVAVSDAQSGQIDIGRFSLENVEEVTLTIGQGDEIFQPARNFASSGILNIKTVMPKFLNGNMNAGVQMKGGSFGMFNPSLQLDGKLSKNWAVSAAGDWMRADGEYPFRLTNGLLITDQMRSNSDVDIWRTELNLYGNVGKGGKLLVKGNYFTSERGLPGSVVLYNTEAHERLWDKIGFVQVGYNHVINKKWSIDGALKYNYAWNRYLDVGNKYPNGEQDDRYTQQEYYASVSTKYTPAERVVITLAQDVFRNTLVATIPECPDPSRFTSMTALAAQYNNNRFTATATLLGVYNREWVKRGSAAPERKHLSPSLGVSFRVLSAKNLRVRASVKDAYRVPTFNDLYYARIGNTFLKPEKAIQYNVGVTFSDQLFSSLLDYITFSFDGYYNQIEDKIVAIPTMFIWKMLNMGKVEMYGTDLSFGTGITVGKNVIFNLSGNYSYQYAVDLSDREAKNYKHQIPYTPGHSGNIAFICTTRWVNVGYTAVIVGERYALPQNIEENQIKGYCEQNVSVNRKFDLGKCSLQLQAEVLNVTDTMYDVIQYYPMPGRQFRFTLKLKY